MLAIQPSRAFFGPGKALGASLQLPTRRSALHTKPQSFVPSLTRSISALPHSRRRPLTQTRDLPSVRSASTVSTAAPPPSATAVSASSTHPAASDETRLTWNRFLQLRAVRRRFNLAASAVSATASVATGVGVLASVDLEAFSARLPLGLDPVFALGLLTVGCGALGWLLGPFAGNAAFGAYYRGLRREIAAVSTSLCGKGEWGIPGVIVLEGDDGAWVADNGCRRRKSSINALSAIARTPPASRSRIPCRITMARRSRA